MVHLLPNVSFGCKSIEDFKSHPEAWEAIIIKWSIYCEPHIFIKTHQSSKVCHNSALHYIILLSSPCMSPNYFGGPLTEKMTLSLNSACFWSSNISFHYLGVMWRKNHKRKSGRNFILLDLPKWTGVGITQY